MLLQSIQANIIEIHHTCPAGNRAEAKCNRIYTCKVYTELLRGEWGSIKEAFDAYTHPDGTGDLELLGWHGIYTTDEFMSKWPDVLLDMLSDLRMYDRVRG